MELFDLRFEARSEETTFVTSPPSPPKGKSIGKKYRTLQEVLGLLTPDEQADREAKQSLSGDDIGIALSIAEDEDALESFLADLASVGSAAEEPREWPNN